MVHVWKTLVPHTWVKTKNQEPSQDITKRKFRENSSTYLRSTRNSVFRLPKEVSKLSKSLINRTGSKRVASSQRKEKVFKNVAVQEDLQDLVLDTGTSLSVNKSQQRMKLASDLSETQGTILTRGLHDEKSLNHPSFRASSYDPLRQSSNTIFLKDLISRVSNGESLPSFLVQTNTLMRCQRKVHKKSRIVNPTLDKFMNRFEEKRNPKEARIGRKGFSGQKLRLIRSQRQVSTESRDLGQLAEDEDEVHIEYFSLKPPPALPGNL